ncbi:uncharacterized protein N0V89_010574 [Didymosphaeria variabile]|uniref:NACHT domain-containing protein n=1 Tax=Didymosphaeria variabile TaxID=1932322 RepID=A0A9W9C6P7_9PLEO|nr:uncharacterized protein N0V89_010574 [Didymosphaeria variabile]KAJ4346643.1 hypothetical protein N0V89_010574 [Didymosphaeria variabile]
MEALAAVSLAGNILQFVHTAKQLVSVSREILDFGAKSEYIELQVICKDLQARADRIRVPKNAEAVALDANDESMVGLAVQCKYLTERLLGVLEKLGSKDGNNKWKTFLQALKTQWHDSEIEDLRKRLDRIGQAVQARLARDEYDSIKQRLDALLVSNEQMEITRARDIIALQVNFKRALSQTDEETSAESFCQIASEGLNYTAEQIILTKVRFPRLEDRYSSISAAHRKTLAWLFGTGNTQGRQVSAATFVEWLRSGDKIYWISGRPGSGKSTLMKFLCTHPETTEHLEAWAKGDEVIIAEYFFWNAGKNRLQKSQEGLLRSIIYQILRQRPEYIRLVFPGVWSVYDTDNTRPSASEGSGVDPELPVDEEGWFNALKCTCKLLTQSGKRLFLFIDGLDEFEGNKLDIISLIQDLRSLDLVKLCVSSRQWNEFEDAYGRKGTSKLYMQDFNDEDISSYIDDTFSHDENYKELEDTETRGRALVEEIVSRSNGVFLWVILVVRSFQEGLREGDSITRLQKRLQELPTELEEYFERILFHDVKQAYRDQAAQMFFITLEAKENLPLMAYWFLDEPELPAERRPLKMQQTAKRHKDAKKRLIASCKGLLEPHFPQTSSQQGSLPSAVLFEYKVDFLHRTVRDYLALPTTNIRNWAPKDFDPHEAICKVLFAQVKTAPQGPEYGPQVSALCRIFDHHARAVLSSEKRCDLVLELSTELHTIEDSYSSNIPASSNARTDEHKPVVVGITAGKQKIPMIVEPTNVKVSPVRPSSLKRLASKLSRKKSKSGTDL